MVQAARAGISSGEHKGTLPFSANEMRVRNTPKVPTRAQRFPLHFRVYYRELNSPIWLEGRTENISHTGMLFRCSCPLRLKTVIELRLMLGVDFDNDHPAEVLCRGAVVRVDRGPVWRSLPALAVAIQRHRVVRGQSSAGYLAHCA